MNRSFNLWIVIFSVITLAYVYLFMLRENYGIYSRLIITDHVQYRDYVVAVGAVLVGLIALRRSSKKWTGMGIVNRIDKFTFNSEISKERRKHVVNNGLLEVLVFGILLIAFLVFGQGTYVFPILYGVIIVDSLLNLFLGANKKKYRIGMTNKAIVAADREVNPIYFQGLKMISKHKGVLYFEYINDLVLDLELNIIPEEKQEEFFQLLREIADEDKVFFKGFVEQ